MSEITMTTQSEEVTSKYSNVELQSLPVAYKLDGKNYLKWSQVVKTFLKGKGKLNHLLKTGPNPGDSKFDAWDEEDSMIMSWLWNSMSPEISDTCMFLPTAKDIWEAVQQTYSKVRDAAQVYEIRTKIAGTKQGNKSVTEYANVLKNLWQELDHYRCVQMKCSEDATMLKQFIERDRVYDFLAGLNAEFDQVRVQILGKEEVPLLNETILIVRAEESRRSVMLETQAVDGSAMATTGANIRHWGPSPNQKQANNQRQLATEEGRANPFRSQNRDEKDNLWCSYCKKSRHKREYCWKLIGKPPSKEWGYKGGQSINRGQSSNEGQAYLTRTQLNSEEKLEMGEFNKEEVEKLRSLLGNLEKPSETLQRTQQILQQLKDQIKKGKPIIGAGAGTGISAKFEEVGGVDLIVLYNSGRFRMAGRGSLAGLLPFADANAVVLDMANEVLPVVKRVPVLAGVCGTDPFRRMDYFLKQLESIGFSGVQNFPTVGLFDGNFRQNLEETGMGYSLEVEMIAKAHNMGFLTTPYAFNQDEAISMAEAGADIIVAHMGLTTSGSIGAQTSVSIEESVGCVQAIADAAHRINPDAIVLCHGGPISSPGEAEYVLKRTKGVHGFYGASSLERLPVEQAITATVQQYKSISFT